MYRSNDRKFSFNRGAVSAMNAGNINNPLQMLEYFDQQPTMGGFASAAFGSLAGSGFEMLKTPSGFMIAGSAFTGGMGSVIAGGDFAQGAIMGGLISTVNHAMHPPGGEGGGGTGETSTSQTTTNCCDDIDWWEVAGTALDIGMIAFDIATFPSGEAALGIAARKALWLKLKSNATKSSLELGQKMHKAYKAGLADNVKTFKEFRLPSGKRIDFLDIEKGIIYELKPNNYRAIQAGSKQLQMYIKELQSMPQFQGIKWKTVIDTY